MSEHVTVANMGPMPGQEVVQLYVRDIDSSVSRPVRELTGFVKVGLEPAESKRVSMDFSSRRRGRPGRGVGTLIRPISSA